MCVLSVHVPGTLPCIVARFLRRSDGGRFCAARRGPRLPENPKQTAQLWAGMRRIRGPCSSPGGGRAPWEAAEAAPSRHPLGMQQGEAWPRCKHRARKLPLAWERSSRAAARETRRPRQNDVLENRLFRAPLQLLRATAKRTAAAREAAATRGDNRQPCSSGTLQPRVTLNDEERMGEGGSAVRH